jgi:hypothetical protein
MNTIIIKTRAEYDATKALNNSGLKVLISGSPAHYKAHLETPREETKALRIGSAVHRLALEGQSAFDSSFAIFPELDRRTKDGKAAYDALILANAGKTALTSDEGDLVKNVSEAAVRCMERHSIKLTKVEHMFSTDLDGVRIKSALDGISDDGYIYDLKTTGGGEGGPQAFLKSVRAFRYNLQAYFYRMAYEAAFGIRMLGFRFIVVEKEPPFASAVYELGPEVMTQAAFDFEAGFKTYKACLALDEWPAYPDEVKVIDISSTKTAAAPIQFA